eukprot:jgi/Ulvmu1/7479/UM037_0022.1
MSVGGHSSMDEGLLQNAPPHVLLEHGAQLINGVRATFRLYYVMEQNVPSSAELVVVGFDTRKTGHYEYVSVDPSVPWVDQLHAKNKTAVRQWLREHRRAEIAADRGIMARIAEPPEDAVCRLLLQHAQGRVAQGILNKLSCGADAAEAKPRGSRFTTSADDGTGTGRHSGSGTASTPGHTQPQTEVRRDGWTDLFECNFKDPEGRKMLQFVLRDTVTGAELPIVQGGEVRPNSRRYHYRVIAGRNRPAFTNRQQALDWIYSQFQFAPSVPDSGTAVPLVGGAVPVSSVFTDGGLAQWALADPDSSLMKQLARSASALDALYHSSAGGGAPAGTPQQAVARVLGILEDIAQPRVGMQALDSSRIVISVLPYLSHPHSVIADRAGGLITTWRAQAQRTEALVQGALDSLSHAAG